MHNSPGMILLAVYGLGLPSGAFGADPLHKQIDTLVMARANDEAASPQADDAEFARRVFLDFAGRIPSVTETRTFLAEKGADKRARLIDRLLAGPDYPRRMQELFHVMLMERLGDNPEWTKYLRASFAANKPWDQMARDILGPPSGHQANRGAAFFYSKRLENYGQNPVDFPALTRDVGRLFLGMDLRCAQCHDHLFVRDYKQKDFQGLFAFFQNTFVQDAKKPAVGEKPTTQKVAFMSVFGKNRKESGPRVPGLKENDVPPIKKGEEYLKPPDPKTQSPGVLRFSPLAKLAEQLPTADNPAFARNMANRLWFLLMGRGLVHPLDLHHSDNPPSHPELLDLLAKELVTHKFDIKWLLREMALSQTYQRSSVLPLGTDKRAPDSFLTANEKRLSAEQLLWSMLEATGERQRVVAAQDGKEAEQLMQKFLKAFGNPAREPEDEFNPSLRAALFVLNDSAVLTLLAPRPGNLVDRLGKITEANRVAEELYLAVLSRLPSTEEREMVARHLANTADRRHQALGQLVWALLASTEFCVNH